MVGKMAAAGVRAGMGMGAAIGSHKVLIGMISFPMNELLEADVKGWYQLLDEHDGCVAAVPLKKLRVSRRVSDFFCLRFSIMCFFSVLHRCHFIFMYKFELSF